jgi:hypothetical protein
MPLFPGTLSTAWTPADYGWLTWHCDVALVRGASAIATSGLLHLTRLHLPVSATVTNIVVGVGTAGNTLTSGQCFAALFTSAGALLSQTADQATAWASTGLKTMALAVAQSCAAGDYYVGVWANGTTGPALNFTGPVNASINGSFAAPNLRFASADTGLTTTAPNPFGVQTALSTAWWAALS